MNVLVWLVMLLKVPVLGEATQPRPTVIDLTHVIDVHMPTFSGRQEFTATQVGAGSINVRTVEVGEHTGTHVDAPIHFVKGKATVDVLPAGDLVATAVVLDVRSQVKQDPDYRVRVADLEQWERAHGRIPYGALVIASTGWSARWTDAKRYRNADAAGVMHFPGFGTEAVAWLIHNRPRVVGIAIDTLSVDPGPSTSFDVHKLSGGAGFYHVENLDRPDRLPAKGATVVVGVIPFDHGSGAPARVLALVPYGTRN
jgi:kynurenine formamidase